jgi:ribonuclease P protein component
MEILFEKGASTVAYPLKLIYIEPSTPLVFQAQAMFVVPKRSYKKAHDRNLLKRRMRESYRLSKNVFYENLKQKEKKLLMAFIYTSKKQEEFKIIEAAVLKLLNSAIKKK